MAGYRDAKMKLPSAGNLQLSAVASFKPGVGQNTALLASPDARSSVLFTSAFPAHSTSLKKILRM